jgi:hypothetical protein
MLEKRSAMLMEQARLEGEVPASAEKFYELLHDDAFRAELMNCASEEAVKELLDRNGVDFSMEEIDAILIAVGNTMIKLEENNGELSEEDLEQVAGGWTWGGFFKGLVMGVVVTAVIVAVAAVAIATSVATGGTAAPLAAVTAGKVIATVAGAVGMVAAGGTIGGVAGGIVELS